MRFTRLAEPSSGNSGPGRFLQIYFGSIIGGGLLSLYIHRNHDYSAYGASGGVCGLMLASVLAHPDSRMSILYPLPYAVTGWLFGITFLVASFYAMQADRDNIGHDAHIGGALIGMLIAAGLQPRLVQQHWAVFAALAGIGAILFAYLLINPLFLPLSSFMPAAWPAWKRSGPRLKTGRQNDRIKRLQASRPRAKISPGRRPSPVSVASLEDWLISEIELHVGKLAKDETGHHDWTDKLGRTYNVVAASSGSFELQSFTSSVLSDLNNPRVNYVIADTRQLEDSQVNLLRPFFANLPDAEFNRVLRSFAFKQRRG